MFGWSRTQTVPRMRRVHHLSSALALIVALLTAACNAEAAPQAAVVAAPSTPLPSATTLPTGVPTLVPTATLAPTETPTPAPAPTATPAPDPMSIEAMRQRQYLGSPFAIEQTLAPGVNYSRYIASYQSEGLKIYGLLTVPNGPKPATGWPAIIFNHGYIPPKLYHTTERYVAYVDAIARSGYIVFKSDYRGHGSSEGEARGAYSTPDYVVDVLNALASMKQFPQADPNRIGMWGHSMGGYITLRAMVISKDIKAGVIWGGVVASYADLFTKWRHPRSDAVVAAAATGTPGAPRGWRNALIEQHGTPEQNPTFWNSISANSYLADLSGPLQLHTGLADTEVPPEFSETLYKQLQAAGQTAELYTYPGSDHNISQGFGLAMQRTIQWFDKYVKGS